MLTWHASSAESQHCCHVHQLLPRLAQCLPASHLRRVDAQPVLKAHHLRSRKKRLGPSSRACPTPYFQHNSKGMQPVQLHTQPVSTATLTRYTGGHAYAHHIGVDLPLPS